MIWRFKFKVYTRPFFVLSCEVNQERWSQKSKYSASGIEFDAYSQFSFLTGRWG